MHSIKKVMNRALYMTMIACLATIAFGEQAFSATEPFTYVDCNKDHDFTKEAYARIKRNDCRMGNPIYTVIIKSADLKQEFCRFRGTDLKYATSSNPLIMPMENVGVDLPMETAYRVVLQGRFADGVTEVVSDIGYTGRWTTRKYNYPVHFEPHPIDCRRSGVVLPSVTWRGAGSYNCVNLSNLAVECGGVK